MATIQELLARTNFPPAAFEVVNRKVDEYTALVNKSNGLVAQINASKAQDPNNVDYVDSLWKQHAKSDEKAKDLEERFDAVAEEYEKLLAELREFGRTKIEPPLSEEAARAARKEVNDAAPTISEARKAAQAQFEMFESVLKAMNIEVPEGGLITLLPTPESLKSTKGRKAATASGEVKQYKTRIGSLSVDGTSTDVNGKGRFDYGAEFLTKKFGGGINAVTGEEIEEAYFASLPGNISFRGLKSTEIPDEHTFTFTKELQRKNPNDDGFTVIPETVKITVKKAETAKPATSDNKAAENKTEDKVETKAPEVMKIDTRTEDEKATAKKTQPAKK